MHEPTQQIETMMHADRPKPEPKPRKPRERARTKPSPLTWVSGHLTISEEDLTPQAVTRAAALAPSLIVITARSSYEVTIR